MSWSNSRKSRVILAASRKNPDTLCGFAFFHLMSQIRLAISSRTDIFASILIAGTLNPVSGVADDGRCTDAPGNGLSHAFRSYDPPPCDSAGYTCEYGAEACCRGSANSNRALPARSWQPLSPAGGLVSQSQGAPAGVFIFTRRQDAAAFAGSSSSRRGALVSRRRLAAIGELFEGDDADGGNEINQDAGGTRPPATDRHGAG